MSVLEYLRAVCSDFSLQMQKEKGSLDVGKLFWKILLPRIFDY